MSYEILTNLVYEDTIFGRPGRPRSWYHERSINSSRLLVTVGDSWTWGDHLGKICPEGPCDDLEYRTTHIYGALLADKLNADFINMAKCGGGNVEMYDYIVQALEQVNDRYDRIDVIITLTENGRELNSNPIWRHNLDFETLDSFLRSYEANMFREFKTLFDHFPKINFLLGRNFTFTYPENFNICSNHLEKTWTEILELNQTQDEEYPKTTRVLSQRALTPIVEFLTEKNKTELFKKELIKLFDDSLSAINWLDRSVLNHKRYTKHPTDLGHSLWADYLYKNIK
jgi:hypothetical protein